MSLIDSVKKLFIGQPANPVNPPRDVEVFTSNTTAYVSLESVLPRAIAKFADQENLVRIYEMGRRTRWSLTGIDVFVQSDNTRPLTELLRLPDRILKDMASRAVNTSQQFGEMFVLDNFFGITVQAASDVPTQERINELGVYGQNETIRFSFAFAGSLTDVVPENAPTQNRSSDSGNGSNQMPWRTPTLRIDLSQLVFTGNALKKTESVCQNFPLVLGRALGKPDDLQGPWIPLFDSDFISGQHLRIDKNAQGQLTITDTSTNGTLLDGKPLPKNKAVSLPPHGYLTLGCDSNGDTSGGVRLDFTNTFAIPKHQAEAKVTSNVGLWPINESPVPPANLISKTLPQEPYLEPISKPVPRMGRSIPTVPSARQSSQTLAVLRVRRADGRETTHAITAFPCDIGREAIGDIEQECSEVSRQHLRIEEYKAALHVR